jgi:hypothetical protein
MVLLVKPTKAPAHPEVVAFLRDVAAKLGTDGQAETFRELVDRGALPWMKEQTFGRWWRGGHAPGFYDTLAMLEASGATPQPRAMAPATPTTLPLWGSFLPLLLETELTPELRLAVEAAADELERSGHETLRLAAELRGRLSRSSTA